MRVTVISEAPVQAAKAIDAAFVDSVIRREGRAIVCEVPSLAAVRELGQFDVFHYTQEPKLVVFDMDSTLIKNECIDLIARRAHVEPQVAEITERAMRGELDFKQSLAERVALLKGVDARTIYTDLIKEIELTPGARELCSALKARGVKMAVLSGGFQPIVDWIKAELGLDYAFANHLVADDSTGLLTGVTSGEIMDGERKANVLAEIAQANGFPLDAVVAVGDGSNDLPMMAKAGYGIAWHAKPIVRQKAPSQLNSPSLADALYVLFP